MCYNKQVMEKNEQLASDNPEASARPWMVSPLDPFADKESVRQRQETLESIKSQVRDFAKSKKMPKPIAEYLDLSATQRFYHEEFLNGRAYDDRVEDSLDITETDTQHSPMDLLTIRESLGMPSIELAKICAVGESSSEDLAIMRAEVGNAIESLGGKVYDNGSEMASLRVINSNASLSDNARNGLGAMALTVNRKTPIGELPDGTIVKEKIQLMLIVNRTRPKPKIVHDIESVDTRRPRNKKESSWQDEVLNIDGFEDLVLDALEAKDRSTVVPILVTTYAHNKETQALAEAKKEEHLRELSEGDKVNLRIMNVARKFGAVAISGSKPLIQEGQPGQDRI